MGLLVKRQTNDKVWANLFWVPSSRDKFVYLPLYIGVLCQPGVEFVLHTYSLSWFESYFPSFQTP